MAETLFCLPELPSAAEPKTQKAKVSAKGPRAQKQQKSKGNKGVELTSYCKNFATNPVNDEYIVHPAAINVLNNNKQTVYKTFADF